MADELQFEEYDQELVIGQLLSDPSFTQITTRCQRDGMDTICHYHRCQRPQHQARLILHFPFYPPFEGVPEVQINFMDQVEGRIRITDQQKFGARVEIVLNLSSLSSESSPDFWMECIASAPLTAGVDNRS